MSGIEIREPVQKRSIKTKDKIIEAGFDLICNDGYFRTNTTKIAHKAGVSTGIVYQYFKDKKDIFLVGLDRYADDILYPMFNMSNIKPGNRELPKIIENIIDRYISNHKLSEITHEEVTAMSHSDKDIASFFQKKEIDLTNKVSNILIENNFKIDNVNEKVHIILGLIDNLCHETVYHKHKELDYNVMKKVVIDEIINLLK